MTGSAKTLYPVRDMVSLPDVVDRLIEQTFPGAPTTQRGAERGSAPSLVPATNLWESEEAYVIELAIPGIEPENVDITFEGGSVLVSGEIPAPEDGEQRRWILSEWPPGRFRRVFTLGPAVDAERAEASYRHGMLHIHLPKRDELKPQRIAVSAS